MLGAIVTSFNDGYKLKEWIDHYHEMKPIIDKYVIVDNGSEKEYVNQIKGIFSEAAILELESNEGTTGAYNKGISYLLNDPQIEHIMLIGNDIRISVESIRKQISYLEKHPDVGMVAPILLKKDSMIIEDGGCFINKNQYTLNPTHVGEQYDQIEHEPFFVDAVTGGMNIAKRSFYEQIGLQDTNLFMYSDEVDMALRAMKKNVKMAMVADAYAWHQHINPQNKILRHPYSAYLIGRNKIYLAYKHGSTARAFFLFLQYLCKDVLHIIISLVTGEEEKREKYRWHLIGAVYGLKHDMKKNHYSSIEG